MTIPATRFHELLAGSTRSAVHLETRDTYSVAHPGFIAWQQGHQLNPDDRASWWRPWLDKIQAAVGRGVEIRRARIVSEPLSDYIRWEHQETFTNIAAGEHIRWLPRAQASDLALPGNDFWLFDNRLVLFNIFAGDGSKVDEQLRDDETAVRLCAGRVLGGLGSSHPARALPARLNVPPYSSSSARAALEALGQRLREIRIDAGLTGRELARRAGWHSSKVSKIEYGRRAPTAENIRDWCHRCDIPQQAADLIAALRTIESTFVQWKRIERTGLRHAQALVLPLWDVTTNFRAYSCRILPGILQTREYTHAILSAIARHRDVPDDVESAVEVRMHKQNVLRQREKRFAIVIEEAALRHRMVPTDIMAGQLGHLLTVTSLPTVSLSIIPSTIQRHRSPAEDFWIFDDRRVSVELVSGWLTVTAPHEVAMYVQAHHEFADIAVTGCRARDLVTAAISALC